LCHNPRVVKEATALQGAGFQVQVVGGWFDQGLKARDEELAGQLKINFVPAHDLTVQPVRRLALGLRGRMARIVHSKTGTENPWQLGYFASALAKVARLSKPDLTIAHSEQALWAVDQIPGRIGVDMEDWFSEDLPPETRRHRPVRLLRNLEQKTLGIATHDTCTSHAMSEALANEFNCRPPAVVYNAFPWSDRKSIDGQSKDRKSRKLPSIHWYSQTLGTDRGLDDLFTALPFLKYEVEIHLRGRPVDGFEDWLAKHVSEVLRKRVFIHPLVSNEELLSRITEHDIGFAGEQKFCRSRDLTVTNKILHYLLGGLAVVASDTAGQREIAACANGAVRIYPAGNAEALAKELNALLSSRETLADARASALKVAQEDFSWERQAPVLLRSIEVALCQ
jgi:glycosyltransferase involved in cell wall biosynthesis